RQGLLEPPGHGVLRAASISRVEINLHMYTMTHGRSRCSPHLAVKVQIKASVPRRREDLLGLLATLNQQIGTLDTAVQKAAEENRQAKLLMTQPGVGPNTALAFVLTIGDVGRFGRGKQVASYLGLIPREESSGGRQKLGAITKQGNRILRSLLVEAAQSAVRLDPQFRKQYLHRCHQKPKGVAKVA